MSSFLNRLKGGTNATGGSHGSTPAKRDPNAPLPTPLERLLADDTTPIRTDGSDKFFGMENFGSTCYCNSIIQCLYYSAPFREQVINFPARTPIESLKIATSTATSSNGDTSTSNPLSPISRTKSLISGPGSSSPKKPPTPGVPPTVQLKEENKDTPEYKKKQALAAGPNIVMDYENSRNYGMDESLFTSLKDIFEAVIAHDSRIGVVSPHKFLEILRRENEMFRTPMHQDAHEFLNLLLNEVVENVEQYAKQLEAKPHSREGSDSDSKPDSAISSISTSLEWALPKKVVPQNTRWVHELFEGTLTSETRCLTCENTSSRDEAFLDLSVDLEQHSSVTSCLRKFSEEEMLCERNKFHCDKCGGLQEAEKRMKIKRLPRILALHLKRFKYTEDLQRLQKLFHRVVYPYYLRLFNTTDDTEDPDRLYELYGIVVHIGGGPYHGHYVSIIKTQDRGWLLFDDENVEPVDKSFVRNYFGGEQNLACAYVLFYQETTFEAMQREQEAESKVSMAYMNTVVNKEHLKTNGVSANGHGPISPTSMIDMHDFSSLNHAVTMPIMPQMASTTTPITPFQTSLDSVGLPFLGRKKSNVQGKKEIEREEKEKRAAEKAAEKEADKLAKSRKKEAAVLQKLNSKKEPTSRDIDPPVPRTSLSTDGRTSQTMDELVRHGLLSSEEPRPLSGNGVKENGASGFLGHSLNRFRQTSMSMSMKAKPKFWGSKQHKPEQQAPLVISAPIPQNLAPMLQDHAPASHYPIQQQTPPHQHYNHFMHEQPSLPDLADPASLPPLPPTPSAVAALSPSVSSSPFTPSPTEQMYYHIPPPNEPPNLSPRPVPVPVGSLTPQSRPELSRTPTPTALPLMEKPKKDKKASRFLIGKKKSTVGFL